MTKENKKRSFRRFHPLRRLEHWSVVLGFFLLVITGLPQKFFENSISFQIVDTLGGIHNTRFLHRTVGIIFCFQFALHMAVSLYLLWVKKIPATMSCGLKDARDAVQSYKFCVGLEKEGPKFGRYDFRQKFEYWGMIVGSIVMIGSGLVLWQPILFASVLPAELIPVARVAHSSEAFLAFMVIILWHMYSVTLNPEVFPLDTAIITGRISEERMHHEHPLELEEILEEEAKREGETDPS